MAEHTTHAITASIPGVENLEPVGRGGFATVYRGWQPEYQRHVAVKVLDPTTDPAAIGRFRREVRAMGAVSDHPNVVPIYGAGVVDGRGYMVMPLLSGGTLAQRIQRAPLDASEVVSIGRALADALAASHRAGLLHRDVKPANVLFTGYGVPQLADFGIARFADATATHSGLVLTVAYAAPEVLQGEPATPASDVYSLGATLHAALRGGAPFQGLDGEPAVAAAMRILSDEPADLRTFGVPAALAAVIERAMAKDPAHRYPTADALRLALETVDPGIVTRDARTAVTVATEPNRARRSMADALRKMRLSMVVGAAAAILLTALALIVFAEGRNDDNNTNTAPTSTGSASVSAGMNAEQQTTVTTALATAQSTTAAPTTALQTTTASATNPTTNTTRPTTTVAGTASPESATRAYYALLDAGRIDEGWSWLSPAYQQQTGRSSYQAFWQTIDRVEVLAARSEGRAAFATLRYTRTNGTTSTENVRIDFVPDATGRLLINGYQTGLPAQ